MQDLVIILPTHNRHDYLGSKIKYYADCGYEVYICDSTSNKFEYNKQMPVNISYLWMPGCGFYEKVLSTLNKVYSKLVILTPDDDFLDMYLQPIITQYFIDNKSEIWLLFLIAHSKR